MTDTDNNTQELKNEAIEVKVEKLGGCSVIFHITATTSLIKAARKKGIKVVAKEVSLPGFRKGKAPDDIIIKKHPTEVKEQTQKALADIAFKEAQLLAKIPILANNAKVSYDLKSFDDDKAEMIFSFETEPSVPSVDAKEFTLKEVTRREVTKKEIDEAIRQMQFFYAKWKDITDRPAQEGDFVIIDIETLEQDPPQKVFSDTRFELTDKSIASWMKKLIIGANTNDSVEGVSFPDDDVPEEEKKSFEPKKVRLTVKKIEEVELPPLDENFAKLVGSVSVEEMEKTIAEMLNKQSDDHVEKEKRDQINKLLIEKVAFELPSSLIKTETEFRLKQLMQDEKFVKQWQGMSPEDKKKYEDEITKQANNSIALFYISRKIVDDAKIPISHEEIQEVALSTYSQDKGNDKKIPDDAYALALSKIMLTKAQDYILENGNKE
jgi:trigger factor